MLALAASAVLRDDEELALVSWMRQLDIRYPTTLLLRLVLDTPLLERREQLGNYLGKVALDQGYGLRLFLGDRRPTLDVWNDLLEISLGRRDDFLAFTYPSIAVEAGTIDKLVQYGRQGRDPDVVLWTGSLVSMEQIHTLPTLGLCMVAPTQFAPLFGNFDSHFDPFYYAGADAVTRILKRNKRVTVIPEAPYAIMVNESTEAMAMRNLSYFTAKWGKAPVWTEPAIRDELYHYPFNQPALGINGWI